MDSNRSTWYCLLLIIFLHLGGIAVAVIASPERPKTVIEPTIQGVLVMAEQPAPPPPEPIPPPPPPPKQEPKPKLPPKPVPKAPPSERAVKAPQPEPVVVETTKKETPVEPTPTPVLPPSADAHELNNPAPAYPSISRRLHEEGTVLMRILVMADGHVAEVHIKTTSGFKRLDDAAVDAIKRWRFNPATQAGKAIDYWYEIDFEFSLKK